MRSAALLLVGVMGCGLPDPTPVPCRPAAVGRFGLGVAHVAGAYSLRRPGEHVVVAGARQVHELGASTLKLFLTPEYQEKYPGEWPQGIRSLGALAASAPMREAFALPFETVVLTTYSFSMGTGDPWRDGDASARIAAERAELMDLVKVLSELPTPTPRTWVIQTWEGDWAYLQGDLSAHPDAARAQRMAAWLDARQRAVSEARERYARAGVSFVNAVELNRVLDADGSTARVVTDVLPAVCTDAVSYSAWEALDVGALPVGEQVNAVRTRLALAFARITEAAPTASVFLGEVGVSEHEQVDSGRLLQAALDEARTQGSRGEVAWQLFDNECTAGTCRGFWLVRPDGSLSPAGQMVQHALVGASGTGR